jgi:hypothetical protein
MKFYVDREDGSEPQIIKMFVRDKDKATLVTQLKGGLFHMELSYKELEQLRNGVDSILDIMEEKKFEEGDFVEDDNGYPE